MCYNLFGGNEWQWTQEVSCAEATKKEAVCRVQKVVTYLGCREGTSPHYVHWKATLEALYHVLPTAGASKTAFHDVFVQHGEVPVLVTQKSLEAPFKHDWSALISTNMMWFILFFFFF